MRLAAFLSASVRTLLAPSARSFARATAEPERAQAHRLVRVLASCAGSQQAARLGLTRVRTPAEFQDAVPVHTADDYAPQWEQIIRGESRVLTNAPVLRAEPSGGSSGAAKLIPITADVLREFHQGLYPWWHDLLCRRPRVGHGPSYWSISPMAPQLRHDSAVPVGSVTDAAYLPAMARPLLDALLAVPSAVAVAPDLATCRYVTLRCLVARGDLAFISVWNPSFLTLLADSLREHGDRLVYDLQHGGCRPPVPAPPSDAWQAAFEMLLKRGVFSAAPKRAEALARALKLKLGEDTAALWPNLVLISTWTDAQAGHFIPCLRARFAHAELQGKGLLATEGVVSLPIFAAPGPVLAVRSHFYEFSEGLGRPLLAHEVELHRTYDILLSTSGGLLRYRLGDRVQVVGFYRRTPCLRFVGRGDMVSDLVGEKISAAWVGEVLRQALAVYTSEAPIFIMLAPELAPHPHYGLFVEGDAPDAVLMQLAATVERILCEGHTYRYARELGQLRPVLACRVRHAASKYEKRCLALGQRAGDIKPLSLHRSMGWTEAFAATELLT